jgi:hypothetical protein
MYFSFILKNWTSHSVFNINNYDIVLFGLKITIFRFFNESVLSVYGKDLFTNFCFRGIHYSD